MTLPLIIRGEDQARMLASIHKLARPRQIRGVSRGGAQQAVLRRARTHQIVLMFDASLPGIRCLSDTNRKRHWARERNRYSLRLARNRKIRVSRNVRVSVDEVPSCGPIFPASQRV